MTWTAVSAAPARARVSLRTFLPKASNLLRIDPGESVRFCERFGKAIVVPR
ncbi:hypothetical protein WME75_01725 [Sorangium sp. So ce1014]|uniref:hypothetical protein n=1 Tax=Sorangium sp. So ce1014 TaxID=3133326 RepID=UPI003F61F656